MFWRLMKFVVFFIRELIFDTKDEYNITSWKFNARKVILFILLVTLTGCNIFLTNRVYVLAKKEIDLAENVIACGKNNSDDPSDVDKPTAIKKDTDAVPHR